MRSCLYDHQLLIRGSLIEETFSQIFPETLETEGGDYIKLTVIDEHLKADFDETAKKKEYQMQARVIGWFSSKVILRNFPRRLASIFTFPRRLNLPE